MTLTRTDIARQRLRNQRLDEPAFRTPGEVVGWLGAVQAQDYAAARWALGIRMLNATDNAVSRAFDDGLILRTHLMRPTWHFVTPADIRWLLMLTAARVHSVNAHMYRRLELDPDVFERGNVVLVRALRGGLQLTRSELGEALRQAGIVTGGGFRLSYFMMQAELNGLVCSGPRRGKQFTYALLDERVPSATTLDRGEALAELARRYFASRGPATLQDFAKWSGLTLADANLGIDAVKAQLHSETVDGQIYWLPPGSSSSQMATSPALLLSIYDEYISSYRDRSAMGEAEVGAKLTALGNALSGIVVVEGRIVGTWKRALGKGSVVVETSLLTSVTETEDRAIVAAAERYGEYLELSLVPR